MRIRMTRWWYSCLLRVGLVVLRPWLWWNGRRGSARVTNWLLEEIAAPAWYYDELAAGRVKA